MLTLHSALVGTEGVIYVVIALLLIVAAVFAVIGTITDVIRGADARQVTDTGLFVLERALLMFIIAEMLYTLRLVDFGGRILVEPFLFIGLIAVVRRILVITAEVEGRVSQAERTAFLTELAALGGLALLLAIAIFLLRRSAD
jgi:hypothetical protein